MKKAIAVILLLCTVLFSAGCYTQTADGTQTAVTAARAETDEPEETRGAAITEQATEGPAASAAETELTTESTASVNTETESAEDTGAKETEPGTCAETEEIAAAETEPYADPYDYAKGDILESIERLSKSENGNEFKANFDTVLNSAFNGKNIRTCLDTFFDGSGVFGGNDDVPRAIIGFMYYCKAYDEMISLVGNRDAGSYVRIDGSAEKINEENLLIYADTAAKIVANYLQEAKTAVKTKQLTEMKMADGYPLTYALLKAAGFSGYQRPQNETEKNAALMLKKLENLYNAVKYGITEEDASFDRYELYRTDEDTERMTPELLAKVRKYYPESIKSNQSYQPFHSQVEGFETIGEWYEYYGKILADDILKTFLSCENRYFFTADGKVYTTVYMSIRHLIVNEDTVYIKTEYDGATVIGFKCSNSDTVKEYTAEFVSDGENMLIIGGSFTDELMITPKYGDAATLINKAIRALSPEAAGTKTTLYRLTAEEIPEGFAQKLEEYYGDTRYYYTYAIHADGSGNTVDSTEYYKNGAAEFFEAEFINEFFDNNKNFIEADGTLYAKENGISFLRVSKMNRVKKLSDTRYLIEVVITEDGTDKVLTWNCTAYVDIISGSPVITGGTLLTDLLLGEFR